MNTIQVQLLRKKKNFCGKAHSVFACTVTRVEMTLESKIAVIHSDIFLLFKKLLLMTKSISLKRIDDGNRYSKRSSI